MSLFNSLGSNYARSLGVYRLHASAAAPGQLKSLLEQRYQAKTVSLTYKGREAIAAALKALGLPAGSSVAVNGYTCYAVYEAITAAGFKVCYLDIDPDNLNFSAETLTQAVDKNPDIKAVMVQNTLGLPADIAGIEKVCQQKKLVLVEDLAHCIGLKYADGREAGTVGQAAALSFSQDKVIDSVTGGALVSRDSLNVPEPIQKASTKHRFATRLYPWLMPVVRGTITIGIGRVLLKFIKAVKLLPGPMSGKSLPAKRLPLWHASVALKSFKQLDQNLQHRQEIAAIYRANLPPEVQFTHHDAAIYLRFPIKVLDPFKLIDYLKKDHIYLSDRWYDAPVAQKRYLNLTNYRMGECPNAEKVSETMLNLPTHRHVTEAQAKLIAERITQWLKSQ